MARTYYQIEVTARQLTVLLLLLGAAMVAAFVLGYGAAVSTRGRGEEPPVLAALATPTPVEEQVVTPVPPAQSTGEGRAAPPAAAVARPTPTPRQPVATAVPPVPTRARPTATAVPPVRTRAHRSHARPTPRPTRKPAPAVLKAGLWVQVLAVTNTKGIAYERKRLARLGFPKSHQRLIKEKRKSGRILYRLQVGPFPDQESALRVRQRMRKSGYRGAWIAPQ